LDIKTHCARITGPVSYQAETGLLLDIPIGPCLIERHTASSIDVIWGANGQCFAALPVEDIEAAHERGHLILLD